VTIARHQQNLHLAGRYNWEHYGNPDGPQAMQFGIGLPAWIVEEKVERRDYHHDH
jgi:preprotein translocase subunit Sec63